MAVPPFMAGRQPGGFGHPNGCHRRFPISTLSDYTSRKTDAETHTEDAAENLTPSGYITWMEAILERVNNIDWRVSS
jgi:hypothetical protein